MSIAREMFDFEKAVGLDENGKTTFKVESKSVRTENDPPKVNLSQEMAKEDISRIGEQIANLDPRTGSFC